MTPSNETLEISDNELVRILRTPEDLCTSAGCVVLDCRPFLAFSLAHICESRNVNWNSMLRRRSKSSVVCLEWLVPDKALLERLRRGDFWPVVVVDESSRTVAELKAESLAGMLLAALQSEVQAQICFLQGNPPKKNCAERIKLTFIFHENEPHDPVWFVSLNLLAL